MKISEQGIALLKEFEALRIKAYICPAGFKTIGYGHKILSHEQIEEINEARAETLLYEDLIFIENSVLRNIYIELAQEQFDALVCFTFNVGSAAFQRSTLRQKINRLEHDSVTKEFMRWVYANGIILPGLVRRRIAESELYHSK